MYSLLIVPFVSNKHLVSRYCEPMLSYFHPLIYSLLILAWRLFSGEHLVFDLLPRFNKNKGISEPSLMVSFDIWSLLNRTMFSKLFLVIALWTMCVLYRFTSLSSKLLLYMRQYMCLFVCTRFCCQAFSFCLKKSWKLILK